MASAITIWLAAPDGTGPPQQVTLQANVRISEAHMRQSVIPEHALEDGSVVSEHVILKPKGLCLVYQQTNAYGGDSIARQTWEMLNQLWQARQPFEIQTEHELYPNMIFERIGALHQAPYKGGLEFTADLKQINFAKWQLVSVPAKQLDPSVSKTASSPAYLGYVSGKDPLGINTPEARAAWLTLPFQAGKSALGAN
jgi:hypothetical protein